MPCPPAEVASPRDYDIYFGLDRSRISLSQWTEGCLSLERELFGDLEKAGLLTDDDRNHILVGMLILYRTTLERWVRPTEHKTREDEASRAR
jgi:hypothetical protein